MTRINFLGGTNKGRASVIDTQRTINFYPEISGDSIVLIGTAGLKELVDTDEDEDEENPHILMDNYTDEEILIQDVYGNISDNYQDKTE